MFKTVLVANRGEIALRVLRACRALGARAVAVYSDADAGAPHVRAADRAIRLGPAPAAESYLSIERVLDAARAVGAEAIHPGYGFLSENWRFAEACREAGFVFVGPPAEVIRAMGEKTAARRRMAAAGVPVLPGSDGPVGTLDEARASAAAVGYPVMLKAAAGGGGIGMALVPEPARLDAAFAAARRRVQSAFGDAAVYVERALEAPRHVEVQVLADHHGTLVHLFERDCSIQRRHQKLIEESPAPGLPPPLQARLHAAALAAARAAQYRNAGTVEFLLEGDAFYFLEMNTRLQVEHPVTEEVSGRDLVQAQLRIAAGDRLGWEQSEIALRGAAIECRIYAEDPERGFLPSPGTITALELPPGPGVRHECGIEPGSVVPIHYDPLLAKVIGVGVDRDQALERLRSALDAYRIEGVRTTLPLHRRILASPAFRAGVLHTRFLERGL
ncbi:MAG TPA: acetyl-CoA carboxylase biotin carboxylase subunit [Methylomirabilota bacterium]|nr:acetyl-CoA carboxylase biotin carboxylase subunit [Methylomirabilota bacterium]